MVAPDDYPRLLRRAIENAGSSRRKLSFEFADRTGNQQPSEYRSIGKYLKGDETPSRERAAILAVLLAEPELALVPEPRDRRRDRLEALEAEVARQREERDAVLQEVYVRLGALEVALASGALQASPPLSREGDQA